MAKYVDLSNLKENLTNFLNKKIDPIYAKKTEIPSDVSELNNDKNYQTAEEVGQAVTDGVAKIVAGAPEDFDTLKEMSDWISSHETSAAAMNSAISDNSVAIANHTANSDIHVTKEEKTKWDNKVDSVTGKALSSNDFSYPYKATLDEMPDSYQYKTHYNKKDGTFNMVSIKSGAQVKDPHTQKEYTLPSSYKDIFDGVNLKIEDLALNGVYSNKTKIDEITGNLSDLKYGEVAGGKNLFNGKYISSVLAQGTDYTNRNLYNEFSSVSDITGLKYLIFGRYFKKGTYTFSYTNDNFLSLNRAAIAGSPCVVKNDVIRKSYTWTQNIDGYTYFTIEADESETSTTDIPFKSTPDIQIEEGITATEYEPYFPSNKMLAEENAQQNENLKMLGKYRNLLNPTLQTTTQNGITYRKKENGTYSISGNLTDTSSSVAISTSVWVLFKGKYKLTGGISNDKYIKIILEKSDKTENLYDYGNGVVFEVNDEGRLKILLVVTANPSVNNVETFQPMLTTNLNATYNDFVPYTGSQNTLTADVGIIKSSLSNIEKGITSVAKAVADEDGNNIKSTYATKEELDTKVNIENPVFTGSFSQNRETNTTIGDYSFAEGFYTEASGLGSHAEGYSTIASGDNAHAEGDRTKASKRSSHAEGIETIASGYYSHAEGYTTTASGECAHAEGYTTTALAYQHAGGHYNNPTTAIKSTNRGSGTGTSFVIGNGQSSSLSNAFRINDNGEVFAKSATISTGADYAEYFEWEDENPEKEDRRGYFVTLNNKKIKLAQPGDYILGIISGFPSVIGNGDEEWMGRYVFDDFNAPVIEEFEYEDPITREKKIGTKWKENPNYDNTRPYIQRSERPEWSPVGMLGVLAVRDDGTCVSNKYCKITEGSIATLSEDKSDYRVIRRVSDNVIEIVFR